jgi:2-iminoacetate synthase
MTLKEYLEDYASKATKTAGEAVIAEQLEQIPSEKIREKVRAWLEKIQGGERDFRV